MHKNIQFKISKIVLRLFQSFSEYENEFTLEVKNYFTYRTLIHDFVWETKQARPPVILLLF